MNQQIGDVSNSVLHDVNTNQTYGTEKHDNRIIDKSIIDKYSCWKHFSFYIFMANIACLIFNIYYICNFFPRVADNLEFDYMGVIVGILSFLITLLIGWNIFSVIDFNKKVEAVMENNNKLKEEREVANKMFLKMKDDLDNLQADMTFRSILNHAYNYRDVEKEHYVIDEYIDALNVAIKDKLKDNQITIAINMLCTFLKKQSVAHILPKRKEFYCNILDEIHPKNERIYFIIDKIRNAEEVSNENIGSSFLRMVSDYNPDYNNNG